ncbi:glutathione S-transferase Mu 1-like isoform X3 [Orbicella faveolata]|uniref:glutathione S-transferase Mu 1-like isoform X3 n=1 Tax=Orbicella faveolata TaxID=48498 RepID=UPI0009E3E89E|nr:glutathione S-transferase Mu 1-like isoform X3 [Orbicella faveolata]
MAPILGYWNVRGLAQPIRYLLAYTETECEYCDYVTGDAPGYDKSCWLSVKETLGLPFPNLPYFIDGDVKLTQTMAIMRHIARKHDLCGTTEEEMMRADVIEGEATDFIAGFMKFTYFSPDFEGGRADYLNSCNSFLRRHSDFLGTYPYFTGEHLSFADFMMYEFLDQLRTFEPLTLDPFQNIKDFMARIEEIPAIKTFLDSEYFRNQPISNKMAHWGTKPPPRH